MPITFFEEVPFFTDYTFLIGFYGSLQDLSANNSNYVTNLTDESKGDQNSHPGIMFHQNTETDAIFFDGMNSKNIVLINRTLTTSFRDSFAIPNPTKLYIFPQRQKSLNLDIEFHNIKKGESYKILKTLVLLKKIGELESYPTKFLYKIQNIGNNFRKAEGGFVKIVYGNKCKYMLNFSSISSKDIKLLEKLYYYNKPFFMSIFPENDSLEELGLRHKDFKPLTITGSFFPKLRSNVLGVGQDISLTFEET